MIATENLIIDGHQYKVGDEIWDLGDLECTEVNGNQRTYFGFLTDINKLPKYEELGTGSSAMLVDKNGNEDTQVLKYKASTKTWYKL